MPNPMRIVFAIAAVLLLATAAHAQPAADSDDAQIVELKRKLAELEAKKNKRAAAATGVVAQAADNTPMLSLENSALVVKNPAGQPVVADKKGRGIDGIKLSQHDQAVGSPSIAVASDGSIHVAFVERYSTSMANAVYYRGSNDGGKTWTEAKNLSEDKPNLDVGRCQIMVDSKNRVYVIWREALNENYTGMLTTDPVSCKSNLVFREMEGGKWSAEKPISEPCTQMTQQNSSQSYFTAVHASGHAQVLWNVLPDKWHPEVQNRGNQSNGVGNGLVLQSTLDGPTAGTPHEAFLNPVTPPKDAWAVPSCDDLDTINGYVDSAGSAHFVAAVTGPMYAAHPHPVLYQLIENAKGGKSIDLPPLSFHAARDIPTLLVDAKGKNHIIAPFFGGEHPHIRDYTMDGDDEPAVIRAAVAPNGIMMGLQACQGPGGRMVAIMQMNDIGGTTGGESFISISTGGGKWSTPVNVTNNAGRKTYTSTDTSSISTVITQTGCDPGAGVVAFDKQGHLLLLMVQNEFIISHGIVAGYAGGAGSAVPTLRFLKL